MSIFRSYLLLLILLPLSLSANERQINYIVIEGNTRLSSEEIIEYSGIQIGKIYEQDDIAAVIKDLYSTNLFNNIKIDIRDNTIFIKLTERPIISNINIEGNKLLDEDQIVASLKNIGISQSKPYSRNLIDKVKQELIRLYYDNGRYSSSVEVTENELENNIIELSLDINEGDASTIKEIKILGNKTYTTRLLKSLIKSGPKYWFEVWSDKDIYNSTLLDQDIEAIRDYYLDRGYAKFKIVSKQVNLSPDKEDIYITLSINEGNLYKFGKTTIYGLDNFDSNVFKNIINSNLNSDSFFSRSNIETAKEAIQFVLGEKGYAFPLVQLNVDLKDDSESVDITIRVDPKKKSFVRRINIKGNTKTNDEVYRRELRQFESSIYSINKVERSKIRLQRLKFVNKVDIKKTIVDEDNGYMDLDFLLEETQSGEFKVGAGYSDSSGAIFNIKVQQDNFLGKGNNVSLEIEKSSYKKLLRYRNTDPYFTEDGISKSTSMVFSETDVSSTSTASYISDTIAYGVNYNVPISETRSYGYGAELILTDYTTTVGSPNNVISFINEYGKSHLGLMLRASLVEDTRNRTVYATQGKNQSITTSLFIKPDFDYSYASVKFTGEYNTPYKLNFFDMFTWDTAFQVKPQLGLGTGLLGESSLPFHDKFFAGGDKTVRGFDSGSLGPLRNITGCTAKTCDAIGGDFLSVLQNDWVFPPPPFLGVDKRIFRGSLFLDIGNVFEDVSDFSYSDLRGSYGVQLNFRTPVGAVSMGFVDTFKSKDGDDTKPIIFSLGGAF
jgi:outer membrane protein insertion porin family